MISQRFLQWPWLLALTTGLLLTTGSSLWRILAAPTSAGTHNRLTPAIDPLPQDPDIQVFFNHSEASVYTDPYRHIERYGNDLEAVIITGIEQAETSIDLAVQALNLPRVASALAKRQQQGLKVRVILENQYANPTSVEAQTEQRENWMAIADSDHNGTLTAAEISQANALGILKGAQVPLIDDTADGSKGSGLMHHKFLVIDNQWVITGSANFTLSGIHGDGDNPSSRGNANALIKIRSGAIAQQFTKEFSLMWGDGPAAGTNSQFGRNKPQRPAQTFNLRDTNLTLQFSPQPANRPWAQSTNGLIGHTLSQSQQSIDLALFVFSEQRIANQLETQVKSGTSLRALIDPSFIYRSYSEALDLLGVTLPDQRCRIEAGNQPWAQPITSVGSPKLYPGDKLHHKFAVIDRATVIVGSQNWSHAANTDNDETLLIINNPVVAAHFSREFERLQRNPNSGSTASLQSKIKKGQQRCRL